MRHSFWTARILSIISLASGVQMIGCWPLDFSESQGGGGQSGSGGGGGEEPPDPGCVPSVATDPVKDTCGVFVSASAPAGGDGTQAAPFNSFAEASAKAELGEKRIYACAETFTEKVELPGGIDVYGGLDCANGWAYVGATTPTTLTAAADEIPLTIFGGSGTSNIEDLNVTAAPAELDGGSSIAVVVDGVAASFARCVFEAQDAKDGLGGANFGSSAQSGTMGAAGNLACSAGTVLGGGETLNDCGGAQSIGGQGGTGNTSTGSSGNPGEPQGTSNGGSGESAVMSCNSGVPGDPGMTGPAAFGASGLGAIARGGFTGVTGVEGSPGTPGQGGGGGGGSKGGTGGGQCTMAGSAGGASGGAGGSGGCGGAGGHGGKPGGSSIALVSLGATLTFDAVTLRAARGGTGGSGGPGQDGGASGPGGPGGLATGFTNLNPGCAGGAGGAGGKGGQGGGGTGGHSIGIAYKGAAPPAEGVTVQTGDLGPGGPGADASGKGADGVKAETQPFT